MDAIKPRQERRARVREAAGWWALISILGILQLRGGWHEANPDAVSYIDIATQFSRGNLDAAALSYWSPAYPLCLALMRMLLDPLALSPFAVAHFTNFFIWIASFACFRWFLREVQLAWKTTAP